MSDLATCWICPECGRTFDRVTSLGHRLLEVLAHNDNPNLSGNACEGTPVEASVVPLSASVQSILNLLPSELRREGWVINKIAARVFNGEAVSVSVDLEHPAPRYEDEYTSVVVVLPEREADPDAG